MVLVVVCAAAGAFGVGLLGRAIRLGIAAEIVASVGVGLALLLVFRTQDLSILGDTLGAEALSGGSTTAAMLAALAVGGWVFIGFDACVGVSEETRDAARHVPRAIWAALLSVARAGDAERRRDDARAPRSRPRSSPAATSIRCRPRSSRSFGSWSDKPFAAVVLTAFLACGIAAQSLTARAMYSISRDGVLPGLAIPAARRSAGDADLGDRGDRRHRLPRPVARPELGGGRQPHHVRHRSHLRHVPAHRAGGPDRAPARDMGSRGEGAARAAGRAWRSTSRRLSGSRSRRSTSPGRGSPWRRLDAPTYQVWAAPILLATITVVGLLYMLLARPQDRIAAD